MMPRTSRARAATITALTYHLGLAFALPHTHPKPGADPSLAPGELRPSNRLRRDMGGPPGTAAPLASTPGPPPSWHQVGPLCP